LSSSNGLEGLTIFYSTGGWPVASIAGKDQC
jgi:hypothetical protein